MSSCVLGSFWGFRLAVGKTGTHQDKCGFLTLLTELTTEFFGMILIMFAPDSF